LASAWVTVPSTSKASSFLDINSPDTSYGKSTAVARLPKVNEAKQKADLFGGLSL
jgi:hypothetical protein